MKEARITEEDDDDVLSIPFECSLPNMDLQAFLQETHWPLDTMNSDLKKYIPDQTNQEPSIEFVRSAE